MSASFYKSSPENLNSWMEQMVVYQEFTTALDEKLPFERKKEEIHHVGMRTDQEYRWGRRPRGRGRIAATAIEYALDAAKKDVMCFALSVLDHSLFGIAFCDRCLPIVEIRSMIRSYLCEVGSWFHNDENMRVQQTYNAQRCATLQFLSIITCETVDVTRHLMGPVVPLGAHPTLWPTFRISYSPCPYTDNTYKWQVGIVLPGTHSSCKILYTANSHELDTTITLLPDFKKQSIRCFIDGRRTNRIIRNIGHLENAFAFLRIGARWQRDFQVFIRWTSPPSQARMNINHLHSIY